MNIGNASGFFVFGVAMWLLPNIAPDLFPRSGMDGSSARAMWIQVMAVVHATIGLSYLLLPLFAALARWVAAEPAIQGIWRQQPVPADAQPIDLAAADAALSQQRALFAAHRLESDGMVTLRGKHAPLWRALKVAFLDEERFMHFLERLRFLAHGHRDRAHADGPAPVVLGHDAEHALIHLIQASGVNFQQLERRSRDWLGNVTAGAFLREVADEVDEVVGDARRAA
jgi:hypothetical protein